jgi:hypothetical protein
MFNKESAHIVDIYIYLSHIVHINRPVLTIELKSWTLMGRMSQLVSRLSHKAGNAAHGIVVMPSHLNCLVILIVGNTC